MLDKGHKCLRLEAVPVRVVRAVCECALELLLAFI